MCGILFMAAGVGLRTDQRLDFYDEAASPCADDFTEGLMRRGPDYQGDLEVPVGPAHFTLRGSLLQLRGAALSANPLLHVASGSALLFNGEVFGGLEVPPGQNDGRVLLAALTGAASPSVPSVLSGLRGPWALVYWEAPTRKLWFGRDAVGRRSLLLHLPRPGDGRLMLSSSAPLSPDVPFEGFSELPPGLYSIQFGEAFAAAAAGQPRGRLVGQYERHSWADPWLGWLSGLKRAESLVPSPAVEEGQQGVGLPPQQQQQEQQMLRQAQRQQPSSGSDAGGCRREAGTGVAVAGDVSGAAGGLAPVVPPQVPLGAAHPSNCSRRTGSTCGGGGGSSSSSSEGGAKLTLAAASVLNALRISMAVRCRCIEEHSPAAAPPRSPLAAPSPPGRGDPCSLPPFTAPPPRSLLEPPSSLGQGELSTSAPSHAAACCNASSCSIPPDCLAPAAAPTPAPAHSTAAASVKPPARTQPPAPPATRSSGYAAQPAPTMGPPVSLLPAPVLILFSGGLDSTLMAALAHEALPSGIPIDLASVCFSGGASPDRQAALDAFEELQAFAPSRQWRLIQVDRSLDDVDALRPRLLRLLAPLDTVMDLNIGAALWLATEARGRVRIAGAGGGATHSSSSCRGCGEAVDCREATSGGEGKWDEPEYCSEAQVVIMGHGADELCGGYGRHRTKFREGGWAGLNDELSLDLGRLWLRNLGRDDRLVADHGREARHPFLDETVIAAVLQTPLELVADLRLAPGSGDKRLLRECLRGLGLPRAAGRVKRAVHFGSGLSKQHNRRHFGSNSAANARSAGALRLSELGLA